MMNLCDPTVDPTINEWLIKEMELEMQRLNVPLDEVQRWLTSTEVPSDPRKKTLYECVCTYCHLLFRSPQSAVKQALGQNAMQNALQRAKLNVHGLPNRLASGLSSGLSNGLSSRTTTNSGTTATSQIPQTSRTTTGNGALSTSDAASSASGVSAGSTASTASAASASPPNLPPALSPFSAESSSTPSSLKPELKLKPEHLGGALPPMVPSAASGSSDFFIGFNMNTYTPLLPSSPSAASASSSGSSACSASSSCCSLLSLSAQSSCSSASSCTMPAAPSIASMNSMNLHVPNGMNGMNGMNGINAMRTMNHGMNHGINGVNPMTSINGSGNVRHTQFAPVPSVLQLPPLDIEMYDVDRSREDDDKLMKQQKSTEMRSTKMGSKEDGNLKMKQQSVTPAVTPSPMTPMLPMKTTKDLKDIPTPKRYMLPPAVNAMSNMSTMSAIPPSISSGGGHSASRSDVDRERYIRCQMKNGNKIKIKAENDSILHSEHKMKLRTTVDRAHRMGVLRRTRSSTSKDSKDSKDGVKMKKDCKSKVKADGNTKDGATTNTVKSDGNTSGTASVTMTGPDGATIIESANSSPSPCPETIACRGGGGIVKTNKAYLRLVSRHDEEGKMETLKWHGVSLAHCFVKRTDTVIKRDPQTGEEYTAVMVAQGHKCMTLNCKYPHLYSQKCHWKRHALTEHCNRKFSCKFCGATFRQQTQRKEHIVNKHTVQMTKWQCPYGCGGVFSQFRGVVRHVKLDRKCGARGKHFDAEEIEALKSGWNNILMKEMLKFETKSLSEENMVSEKMKKEVRAKTKKLYADKMSAENTNSSVANGADDDDEDGEDGDGEDTTMKDEETGDEDGDDAVE